MYRLSNLAVADFTAIYEYTLSHFGARQADAYTDDLERVFQLLNESPLMGHDCANIGAHIRRHDHQQHAIFYRPLESDIFIVRILHQRMEPLKHFPDL